MTQTVENPTTTDAAHDAVAATVEQWRDRLLAASHDLHEHPETAFAEHRSAGVVAGLLREAGFETTVGAFGLDTAVHATYGSGDLTVTVCAEYDALPGIGHACGHNIIATAGVGAALALAGLADELGLRVTLLGTPAEEVGGGKALLLEAGAWEDAAVSLMVHPGPFADVRAGAHTGQGRDRFRVTFTGRAAHAAAAPQHGVNAGHAATLLHVALGLLRQELPDGVRMAAVTLTGGDVSNIIPATAVVEGEVRSTDADELRALRKRFMDCVQAAALASGCTVEVEPVDPAYLPLAQYAPLMTGYDAALERRGRTFVEPPSGAGGGSTDMGNVSQVVPSIHPMIGVLGATGMPHTAQFASETATPAADDAVLDAAYGLACAVVDLALDPDARAAVLRARDDRPVGATRVPAHPGA